MIWETLTNRFVVSRFTKSCMHSSAFDTSLYPSLSKRQKDKKAHDSFEDGNEEKEADQQGKKQKAKAMFS